MTHPRLTHLMEGSQFVIATRSPLIHACRGALICRRSESGLEQVSCDEAEQVSCDEAEQVACDDAEPVRRTWSLLAARQRFVAQLPSDA